MPERTITLSTDEKSVTLTEDEFDRGVEEILNADLKRTDKWAEAPMSVRAMAKSVIRQFHPELREARLNFLMRVEPSTSQGKRVWAKAQTVPERLQILLDVDFIIWIDEEIWSSLSTERQEALIDHELCHCAYNGVKYSIRAHDVEEFNAIVERRGLWTSELMSFGEEIKRARQLELFSGTGNIVSVIPTADTAVE